MVDMLFSVMQSVESAVIWDHKETVFAQRQSEAARLEDILDIVVVDHIGFGKTALYASMRQ